MLGNLYGTASRGRNRAGQLYKLTPNGHLEVLHKFGEPERTQPYGDLLLDRSGAIYGLTVENSSIGGAVYQVGPKKGAYEILHTLGRESPTTGLVHDKDGNLYGSTTTDGVPNNGIIFELVK